MIPQSSILNLNFYGVAVSFNQMSVAVSEQLLLRLKQDFSFFAVPQKVASQFEIEFLMYSLSDQKSGKIDVPNERPLMVTSMCRAFGWKNRCLLYPDNHRLDLVRKSKRQMLVTAQLQDADLSYEILHVALLSLVGEFLEKLGFVRLHSCSWVSQQKSYVLSMPPGSGKSMMARRILKNENFQVGGDEVALYKDKYIYPFPIPIGIKESGLSKDLNDLDGITVMRRLVYPQKYLLEIPKARVPGPQVLGKLFWGQVGRDSKAEKPSLAKGILFISWIVLGLGLPQMREYMIRQDNLFENFRTAVRRFVFSISMLVSGKVCFVELKQDAQESLSFIEKLAGKEPK